MAYRNMNTAIYLLEGCPLVKGDENSLYFDSTTTQFNYFHNFAVNSTLSASFQRVNKNTLRVEAVYNAVQFCNYVMFSNGDARTSLDNEIWYYAFVDSINYINDNVVEVVYTIDWLQTCMCYYTLGSCYVERGHTDNDLPYGNLMPEPLNVTNYVYNSYKILNTYWELPGSSVDFTNVGVIGVIIPADENTMGETVSGVYTGLKTLVFPLTENGLAALRLLINAHLQDEDFFKLMYVMPLWVSGLDPFEVLNFTVGDQPFTLSDEVFEFTVSSTSILTEDSKTPLDNFTPKNNKCYTYPFTYYEVNDGMGNQMEYKYELFKTSNNIPMFTIKTSAYSPASAEIEPYNYKTSSTLINPSRNTEKMVMKGFPICAFTYDTYASWLAQNSVPQVLNTFTGLVGGFASVGIGVATGNPISTLLGGMQMGNTITNAINDFYQASIKADTVKGCVQSGNLFYGAHEMQFYGSTKCAKASEMLKIDTFFSRYGYAIGRESVPSKMNRQRFRYLKTNGAVINGDIPQSAKVEIANRYNSGLRLFRHTATYGACYVDNLPA